MNKCNNNMGIADFLEKKQRGDVSRIADALRANGIEISNRMVDYMLKGERTMPEDVRRVVERYYEVQEEMFKNLVV